MNVNTVISKESQSPDLTPTELEARRQEAQNVCKAVSELENLANALREGDSPESINWEAIGRGIACIYMHPMRVIAKILTGIDEIEDAQFKRTIGK